ncbi:glycosyltransferase family 2 protein [Providencia rettgeri]
MKTNTLLSIIIPCFNNGKYIYECLDSLPFEYTDLIEVIIINDGSTDNSAPEIHRFISAHESKNKNILLINKSNQGVSIARNIGIEVAKSKYITFLDADDLWSPKLWEMIEPVLLHNQPDMIIYNASRFYDDNKDDLSPLTVTKLKNGYHTINHINELSSVFQANGWFAWCRVYKKEMFEKIKFPEYREYEDLAIIPTITMNVKSIFSISDGLVLYRSRVNSITKTPKIKHIDDIIYAMESLYYSFLNSCKDELTKNVLSKSMQHEYGLLRSVNKKVYGYCYFTIEQRKKIKMILKPFQHKFKLSLRFKAIFIDLYNIIAKKWH